MKIRRNRVTDVQLETGALSDILFFLLIFFLITSTLTNPNVIKLNRPKSAIVGSTKPTVTISITKDMEYFVNKNQVAEEELPLKLGQILEGKEDQTIMLNIDKDVTVEKMTEIMNVANKYKAKVALAIDKSK